MKRWIQVPSPEIFASEYYRPMRRLLRPLLIDWELESSESYHSELSKLKWDTYRRYTLKIDPTRELQRVKRHIRRVEKLLDTRLKGEIVLFGGFELLDGYARFNQARHRVFLAVDERHDFPHYYDILVSHELTHVAREPLPAVWKPFGLSPRVGHEQYTEQLPVVEHLFNEGLACVVSELLQPNHPPWNYVYQTESVYRKILRHASAVDRVVRRELTRKDDDYGRFYSPSSYRPRLPMFSHYLWAWAWVRSLLERHAHGDPAWLLRQSSFHFREDALEFRLADFTL